MEDVNASMEEATSKLERIKLLEAKKRRMEGLPHLYAFKDYDWGHDFLESENKRMILVCGNQLGKSTLLIRKMIKFATEKERWPRMWRNKPNQFWYLYPSKDMGTHEFHFKWAQLMPAKEFKEDSVFGWKAIFENRKISHINFATGVSIVFKSYNMDVMQLQGGSVFMMGLDEEPPEHLLPELMARTNATNGQICMVFTPTIAQEIFRKSFDEQGTIHETFKGAWKRKVSYYQSMKYQDGSQSPWTLERIKEIEAGCTSDIEIRRRIYGDFVLAEGRLFQEFSPKENSVDLGVPPHGWNLYFGIDYGSGGDTGHPSGIIGIAVNSTFTQGRVVAVWRGDFVKNDAVMVIKKYIELKDKLVSQGLQLATCVYDHSAPELQTVAQSLNHSILPANKKLEAGIKTVNSLFKHQALNVDANLPEAHKLVTELLNVRVGGKAQGQKDDLVDPLRYAAITVPWNWDKISKEMKPMDKATPKEKKIIVRMPGQERLDFYNKPREDVDVYQTEFDEWNALYEGM